MFTNRAEEYVDAPEPTDAPPSAPPPPPEVVKPIEDPEPSKEPSGDLPFAVPSPLVGSPFARTPKTKRADPFLASRRWLLLRQVGIFLLIGLAVIGGGWWLLRANRSTILIVVPDTDVTVTLNKRTVGTKTSDRGLTVTTAPGQYLLTIEKPNYAAFQQTVRIGRGKTLEVRPVFTLLGATSASGSSGVATVDYVRPSLDEKSLFFLGDNRTQIYRMEIANQVYTRITEQPLQAVSDIQWSAVPDLALVTQAGGVYLHEIPRYDLVHQALVRIGGSEIISPIWDPTDSNRIAFAYIPGNGERSLIFADKRATTLDRKADISSIPNPKLKWSPNAASILLIGRSTEFGLNNLWLYTTADGSLSQLTSDGNVLDASFAPDSQTILYERFEGGSDASSSLHALRVGESAPRNLGLTGKVARAAWRDGSSFFLPDNQKNTLILYSLDTGKSRLVPFTFPSALTIQGMHYSATTRTLTFYTSDAIYAVNLAID